MLIAYSLWLTAIIINRLDNRVLNRRLVCDYYIVCYFFECARGGLSDAKAGFIRDFVGR